MNVEFTKTGITVNLDQVKPFVGDDGIYIPSPYDQSCHMMLISKEIFVEAYNKWIKPQNRNFIYIGKDTADDWCEN